MTCTNCPAFKICPEKPTKEDYADENKYLIDLECGVWSCQKTIEKLCKENEQLKQELKNTFIYNKKVVAGLVADKDYLIQKNEQLKTDLEYAKTIIKDLLNNSHEYAKQNAEDFIKGEVK